MVHLFFLLLWLGIKLKERVIDYKTWRMIVKRMRQGKMTQIECMKTGCALGIFVSLIHLEMTPEQCVEAGLRIHLQANKPIFKRRVMGNE